MNSNDVSAAIAALLPARLADYHRATERKHFGPDAVGSVFTNLSTLPELLAAAFSQRGTLDGDDRDLLLLAGADPAAFDPSVRYLACQVPGQLGVVPRATLEPDELVDTLDTKPGCPPSVVLRRPLTRQGTGIATIIIGRDEHGEVLFTAHPGLPIPPVDHGLAAGITLPVSQLPDEVQWIQLPDGDGPDGRPSTVAGVLEAAADWLVTADKAFAALLRQQGVDPDGADCTGDSVQGDLRMLAAWLREHADVDAQMYSVLTAIDAR